MRKLLLVLTLIAQSAVYCAGRTAPVLPSTAGTVAVPSPDTDGFITLFNGQNLAGWTGLADYWSVKDGSISGRETMETSRQTFLILTTLKVTDFELHFRYRFVSPDGNSGVQFRSVILDTKKYVVGGYQADLDAKALYDGSIYDEAGKAGNRGTMSSRGEKTIWDARNRRHVEPLALKGAELGALIKLDDWNDAVLTAEGNHIVYSINGHVMTDLVDDSPAALHGGILALQLHQGFTMDVQFKDIRIKILH